MRFTDGCVRVKLNCETPVECVRVERSVENLNYIYIMQTVNNTYLDLVI